MQSHDLGRALHAGGGSRASDHGVAVFLNAFVPEEAANDIIKSRAEPSRAEPSRAEPSRAEPSRAEPSRAEPSRAEPSLGYCPSSSCPPDSLPSAPSGAHCNALSTEPDGSASASRRRELAAGVGRRERRGRSLAACVGRAAAILLLGCAGAASAQTVSNDATLSALSVSGTTLSPTFAKNTTTYRAQVANSVTQVTITAMKSQSAATVMYLGRTDNPLTDADTGTSGFQVNLNAGTNIIKVDVLAPSSATKKKYTINVFRLAATAACSAASMQNQIWTAQMTVGLASANGFIEGDDGHLNDKTISYKGTNYTVANVTAFRFFDMDNVYFGLADNNFGDTADLVLHAGNSQYRLSDATLTSNTYRWIGNLPNWANGDAVCLALTEIDGTAPVLSEAVLPTDFVILLGYDETLDSASVPDKSQFEVKVEGTVRTIISAGVSPDDGVSLVLAPADAVKPGETVTVSYTVPSSNPIQDLSSNPAAAFTDQAVTNNLAATAPEAPGNLTATAGTVADTMALTWETPWHNGDAITRFRVRYVQGTTAGGTWADILNSDADTTTHTVTGLTAGTQYTFEVRAVNGIGNGAPATVTQTTATPTWELTLTDNGNAVTQLTEGGDPATATVRITNGVTFGTAQTVTLEWDGLALDAASPIQGAGGASEITIPPGQSSGTLVISAPDPGGVAAYTPPRTAPLWGRHGENQISGIDLTLSDDEDPPVATLTAQPAQVSEGEDIEVEIRLSLPYGGNATSTLQLIVTDAAGALVAPLPTGAEFESGELTHAITLTAADNAVHNDGARVVTVALAPSPDASLYTLGAPSSATVVVADNDNVAPVFSDGASATRSVAENTAAGENVGAALTATDTDTGDTLTYTLEGAGAASFDIVSTSGQIRTRSGVTYDHEARSSYSVTVKADDGNAGTATVAVTITVTDVAEPPAAPAAPAVTATSASTTSVDVAWTAPANPGKPAISGYDLRYRVGNSGSWTDGPQNRTGASASIASLTAGTSYQVQVRATNAEGDGPWSDSGSGSTGTASNAAPTFANPTRGAACPRTAPRTRTWGPS